ncbi:glycosyltransferase, partial [bacterium]|nr:glycosyltransferase [bacterium]
GLEILADAILSVAGARPELRLAVVGTGRGEDRLRQALAPLGDRFRLLGYVRGEALSYVYRAADIVAIPSLYEPFGLVGLEAMLGEAAVVAARSGGLAEIVRHEKDGLLVAPGDAPALARALDRLVSDQALRERLGKAGAERARQEFSWDEVARRTQPVYKEALSNTRPVCVAAPTEPQRPLVSVVIVTRDAQVHVETALRSFFSRTKYPALDAIVVDNGSSESARKQLEALVSELARGGHAISLMRNDTTEPLPRAQNQAIRAASGEYVCLLGDESEIPRGSEEWLSGLVWLFETMGAGTVSATTLGREGPKDPLGPATGPRRTEWNRSACLFTRKRFFEEAGPLREETELASGGTDREWCLRLLGTLGLGHWVHSVPVHHYEKEARRDPSAVFQATDETRLPASVVIVAYNSLAYTRECLESVLAGTAGPFELVLVDNGSRDGTRDYFHTIRDQLGGQVAVQVIGNAENLGYTKAANQGARAARGRAVVLLNNDTRVRPGWLEALVCASQTQERVGIVTAKILNMDGSVQNAGGILHHPDGDFTIPNAGADRRSLAVSRRVAIENAGGPCMLLTRALLETVGIFDEDFSPGYFEDSDLSLRAREAGFALLYEPDAEVHHHAKVTSAQVAREGKLDVWGRFEENKRRFHGRWRKRLEADEAGRRALAETGHGRRRILLCYNKSPTTTAAYCEAALRREHDVVTAGRGQEIDQGDGASAADLVRQAGGAIDLLLAVEGENYLPRDPRGAGCPTAWWAIDNHIHSREGGYFEVARQFDHVFIAQRDYARVFRAQGIESIWLPHACDPEVHGTHAVERDLDVVFVGNVLPIHERRRRLLDRLKGRFQVYEVAGAYREDMARLYSRAKVVWNCSLAGDLNMRVFEALASGSLLVTDRIGNGLTSLFGDGEHLALYDEASLEDVVARCLADAEARETIGRRGRELVLRHHTYRHRMAELVEFALRPGTRSEAQGRALVEAV